MRLWVHTIWIHVNKQPLQTMGPKENALLEAVITAWEDEVKVALGWYLYCTADPRPYNLQSVMHVDEMITKTGKRIVSQVENQAAITRFPLSAFLSSPEGYIVKAAMVIDELPAANEEGKRIWPAEYRWFLQCMKAKYPSLKTSW
jgi:hypothetical protein